MSESFAVLPEIWSEASLRQKALLAKRVREQGCSYRAGAKRLGISDKLFRDLLLLSQSSEQQWSDLENGVVGRKKLMR